MGKWNRRYMPRSRRRDYQDYQWSPPRDEPCPDPETEVWQDNVPLWEKKFCYLVGRMPWKKVLSTKNFMHCHSNILKWDDSAGEEAFHNAKKRFWEEMNGLPCETQQPNPDMYIDEIDWNPFIDPGLIRELDREYFNPDDKYYLPSACSSNRNKGCPDDGSNPWESGHVHSTAVQDKATGWNQWDNQPDDGGNCRERGHVQNSVPKDKATSWNQWDNRQNVGDNSQECNNGVVKDRVTGWNKWDNSVNGTGKLTKDNDPWESCLTKDIEVVKDSTWGGAWHKSWGSKPQNQSEVSKNWGVDGNSWRNEGNRWQDRGASSRSWNQKKGDFNKPSYMNNNYKPPEYGSRQGSRMPNGRGNACGQRRWDNYTWEAKDLGSLSRGRGQFNAGCRKREGPDQYATNHKGPRLHGVDSQSSRHWNGANNNRVSFGAQWS